MRFYTMTMVIVGMVLILNLGGIQTPLASGLTKSLNLVDDSQNVTVENVKSSGIWSNDSTSDDVKGIRYLLLFAIGAGLVIGAFGRAPDIRYITAGFVFSIGGLFLADLIYLYSLVSGSGWIGHGIGVIVGGLTAGFIITMIQFWQGTE